MIRTFSRKTTACLCCALALGCSACAAPTLAMDDLQDLCALGLDESALVEALPLAMEALEISHRAAMREAQHKAELAKRGIAEVPPSVSAKYVMNAGLAGRFVFDNFGEFYIDRYYSDEYADKILRRANDPDLFVPIEIKLAGAR